MERLTYRNSVGDCPYLKYGLDAKWCKMERYDVIQNAVKKLAEYEDLEEKLYSEYGECDGLLQTIVDHFVEHFGIEIENPYKARLLTDGNIDKWEHFKELEADERLLELPCKIGDIVYDLVSCDDNQYHIFEMKVCNIVPFGQSRNGKVWNIYLEDNYTKAYRSFYDIGKTVFFTKEEAEQILKERSNTYESKTFRFSR